MGCADPLRPTPSAGWGFPRRITSPLVAIRVRKGWSPSPAAVFTTARCWLERPTVLQASPEDAS